MPKYASPVCDKYDEYDSRSRLDAWDWKKFSFSSRSTRLKKWNSRSRLEHEIKREQFSFPSRELKKGSRHTLAGADAENHIRGYDADDDDRFEFGGAASAGYEQTDTSS